MGHDMTEWVNVAVCGAHMSGLPLNHQLVNFGGELVSRSTTAAHYRFYKLAGFEPPRPGLIRVNKQGSAIDLEVWRLPLDSYGKFVTLVPAPLCIGTVTLIDGSTVQGFLCETYAIEGALDISLLGGWRSYLESRAS
jgi:allophanate hydrolase